MATVAKLGVVQEAGAPEFALRHYSPAEIGRLWNLSPDTIRHLFQNEPGVLQIGEKSRRGRRRYVTLRIPEFVAARVHRRLSRV
jgi:hypothetical protein